ncbi:hypothetical protein [Sphingobium chungangianum]
MAKSHMRVIYDGPSVEDGEMDVSQLASSLLALGKLIEASDAIITGEPGRIKVRVQSDVRRGSFDVGIVIDFSSAWDAAKAWVMTPEGATTSFILSTLGFNLRDGVKGLIQTVRWLKGHKVAGKIVLEDGNTRLETADGDALIVPPAVGRIADEPQVRQPLERFTEPLRDDGIDVIRFEEQPGKTTEQIKATEAAAFKATGSSDPTSTSRFEATYQIKRLYFEQGKKWRLSSGAQAIMAEIEDRAFWERIANSEEVFSANDFLVCRVRMDQWLGTSGLKTEHAVEEVLAHIPAPKQPRLLD